MARELQELRSRKEWDAHTHMHDSGTDPAGCSASSVDNRSALEDAEDDFDFSAAVVSLGDVFIQPQMAVGLFRMYVKHPLLTARFRMTRACQHWPWC